MSDKSQSPDLASVPPETDPETSQSLFAKTKRFVASHKKSTIAVGALVGLVGLAAVTGKKTATVTIQSPLELEVEDETETTDPSA